GSGPGPFTLGEKRLDTFGSLVIRDGSGPVEFCLPLVPAHVADPCRRCPVVHAGRTLTRLGRMAERLSAGGQPFCGGRVRRRWAAATRSLGVLAQRLLGSRSLSLSVLSRARTASSRASISRRRPGGGAGSLSTPPSMPDPSAFGHCPAGHGFAVRGWSCRPGL